MTEKYQQALNDLLNGQVSELVIAPEEFNVFYITKEFIYYGKTRFSYCC